MVLFNHLRSRKTVPSYDNDVAGDMKNQTFVAIDPQLECSWKYMIPAKAEYISGTVKEMLSFHPKGRV